MKIKKVVNKIEEEKEPEEDYNFNFDIYEQQEKEAIELHSITKNNKPNITNLRSRYSPSMLELENLSSIRQNISMYSISVSSNSQDITDLWKLYGCLDEFWAKIHDIFGTIIIKEVETIKTNIINTLNKYNQSQTIPYKVHLLLLNFRNKIYMLAQRINLGIEVERSGFSHYDKARKGLVE